MSPEATQQAPENVMRRLKAMLALASDPAAAPGEAENAMRMAQNLMRKYGVTDGAIAQEQIGEFMFKSTKATEPPVWESWLMQEIARAFGARVLWASGRGLLGARDKGHFIVLAPKPHLDMMKYAFELLRKQLVKKRAAFITTLPSYLTRPAKAQEADTFGVGFVENLATKISDYAGDETVKAALDKRYKEIVQGDLTDEQLALLKKLRKERKSSEFKFGSAEALLQGHAAGKDAHLNRGVT
jgi:hypothetical protein